MRFRWLPWLMLCLAVASVLAYWHYSVRTLQREVARDFRLASEHAVELFSSRFHFYGNILNASRGLFDSSELVTEEEWHGFVRALQVMHIYPGLEHIFYARYQPSGEAGVERFMAPIHHLEPDEQKSRFLGYDLAAEPTTRETLRAATDSGEAVLSGVLEDPISGKAIVRHLLPVFRHGAPRESAGQRLDALRGWVGIDFDVQRWLSRFVAEVSNGDWHLDVVAGDGEPVFSSAHGAATRSAAYRVVFSQELGQRNWRLSFHSTAAFEQRRGNLAMHLFPLSALLLILSLWLVFRRLLGGRAQAMALAERMTEQLRESEARYREMFEANKAVELLIDPEDGRIVDANQAAVNYYGYRREELQRMTISDINTLDPEEVAAEMARARSEKRSHFLFKHRHATGEIRDVEVHSGPIQVGGRQLLYSIVHDVTARMESERALRESEARYHTIIDTTGEGYWLVALSTMRIVDVNEALCRILGYPREALIGKTPFDFVDEENRRIFEQQAARVHDSQQRSYEITLRHKDGHGVSVQVNATNMPNGDEAPEQAFAFITDISERKRIEEQLRIAATFFETTSEAITVTDSHNRIVAVNPAFSYITGYSEKEVLGKDPGLLSSNRHSAAFYRNMWHTLQRMGRWQGEIWNRRKNGEVFPEWLSIVGIKDGQGETTQYMAVFSDITKRKQDEQKIWRQANYDALTGLPNRNLFKDRLDRAMHAAHREGTRLALMFIDLDRFKWVNDTLGHATGDRLLQEAANRLRRCVRETDTVARLGGDEFTVILGEVREGTEVERIAEKLLHRLAAPFELDGKEAFVSGSIGITLFPGDADNMEQLLRNADAAMYLAKQSGRNTFHYFTQQMNEEAQRRLQLESDLRRVLERDELLLHYQPIIDGSGRVAGAEALLRWQHPELGLIPPDEFIPLAEEIGVIVEMEQWVMRQACHDARAFQLQSGASLFVSVNVSSMQCKSDRCRMVLGEILQQSGLPAECLKLEITERVMMENTEHVIALLSTIRSMGVRLAVDDFGTGYSSLSYLKQFPVDVLKIDRAFIDGLPTDKDDVALVEAIVAMAHSLELQVVAEGVESADQLAFLSSLGCDMIQGYYFSKPLPFEAFEAYLRQH
jgi:diguanylate cyclase (GGDEF)-like protein/PAS domain S-box-containing protein